MKFKMAILLLLAGSFAAIENAASQTVYITNLLDNVDDSYIARTQSPIKVDVYQGEQICYTLPYLSFGDQYTFQASTYNPACLYISKLVVTPLKVGNLPVYTPVHVYIEGGQVTHTQVTIIQTQDKPPIFNRDGTVTPGAAFAQINAGVS